MINVTDSAIYTSLLREKLAVIIRNVSSSDMPLLFDALDRAGARFTEVTMNTEGAERSISAMREKYDGRIYVGAGTVLTLGRLREALAAGAQYIVTPNTNPEVIRHCAERGILVIPGAMTPSEIAAATAHGATMIKLFPANSLGAGYLKELSGPFAGVKFFPVGGITLENIPDFLRAGAVGFGIGGSICNLGLISQGKFGEIEKAAVQYVQAAKAVI